MHPVNVLDAVMHLNRNLLPREEAQIRSTSSSRRALIGGISKVFLFGIDQMRSIRILWVSLIFFKMGLLLILRYKDQSIIFLIEENV